MGNDALTAGDEHDLIIPIDVFLTKRKQRKVTIVDAVEVVPNPCSTQSPPREKFQLEFSLETSGKNICLCSPPRITAPE